MPCLSVAASRVPISNQMLLKLYMNWEDLQRFIREYSNPTPGELYVHLGRSTKVLGNIKTHPR